MYHTRKFLSVFTLVALLALAFATPAYAFDGRGGDRIVIESGEVVNDDLYVGAQEFAMEGTVNGDLVAFAQTVTVNGTVNGDLITAGQTVILNGKVTGSVRMAGSVLFVGEKASIGEDLVGAGYSLEVRKGSAIGQDLIVAGGQILLAGDVARNVQVSTGALDLRGHVGGDVKAELGNSSQTQVGPPPTMFMPQSTIPTPYLKPGLTLDPSARIEGNLAYTLDKKLSLPSGIVGGKVTFSEFVADQTMPREATSGEKVAQWALDFLRDSITIILIGLFLLWLFPGVMKGLSEKLQAKPLPSLGWGAVAWAAFFIVLLLVIFITVVGGILFGVLTLGQLTGTVIWLGVLALFALIIGFVLTTSFVSEVIFGTALGKWILVRAHSPLAENRYLPMVIGVLITLAVIAMLSFPLIPNFFGWLLNFAVVLFGLGALWIWGRDRIIGKTV